VSELDELVARYVAAWNEPHPDKRRALVVDLWNEGAIRYNHAGKQDGRDAIADAVASTYARFGARGLRFRPIGSPVGHHQVLKFSWEMFTAETGEVDSIGTTFLLLNLDNMIERDYQFTEETPGWRRPSVKNCVSLLAFPHSLPLRRRACGSCGFTPCGRVAGARQGCEAAALVIQPMRRPRPRSCGKSAHGGDHRAGRVAQGWRERESDNPRDFFCGSGPAGRNRIQSPEATHCQRHEVVDRLRIADVDADPEAPIRLEWGERGPKALAVAGAGGDTCSLEQKLAQRRKADPRASPGDDYDTICEREVHDCRLPYRRAGIMDILKARLPSRRLPSRRTAVDMELLRRRRPRSKRHRLLSEAWPS
jgi:hypothetical protein